jgi:hypothetical protein
MAFLIETARLERASRFHWLVKAGQFTSPERTASWSWKKKASEAVVANCVGKADSSAREQ